MPESPRRSPKNRRRPRRRISRRLRSPFRASRSQPAHNWQMIESRAAGRLAFPLTLAAHDVYLLRGWRVPLRGLVWIHAEGDVSYERAAATRIPARRIAPALLDSANESHRDPPWRGAKVRVSVLLPTHRLRPSSKAAEDRRTTKRKRSGEVGRLCDDLFDHF